MTMVSSTVGPALDSLSGDWTRALFEAIDDAVFVHDQAGKILEANPAACRRLGYTREEMLLLTTRDIDDPEFAAGFKERLAAQMTEGSFRCEGRHRTKDGRIIPVDINTSAVFLHGKPAVLAVMRDITQQKQAEQNLARQSDLLHSILDSMGDAVVVADTAKHLLMYNPAAQRLFGLRPPGEEVGKVISPRALFLPDQVTPFPAEQAPLERCIRGEEVDEVEMFVRLPDSAAGLWVSVTGRPMRDERGRIKGGVIVCRDFTERKRAASRLAAQFAVARALTECDRLAAAAGPILQVLCETLGLDAGILWLVEPTRSCLVCAETWHRPTRALPKFMEATRAIALDVGRDLPGQCWADRAATARIFAQHTENMPLRLSLAQQEGLKASFAFPIQGGDDIAGVVELLSGTYEKIDDELISLMTAIGSQIGQVLERQKVEAALRDSEALYHSLVQSLPQNVFRKDRAGRVTFGNEEYCKTLKMPLAQLLGKTDFDLFPPELAAKYVEDDRKVLEDGDYFETIEKHHLPDGDTIFVQVVKTPVYDSQGNIVGIQGIFWDVTQKQRAADILTASERRYRQLTEATLDGILLIDHNENIRLFNPAAESMFGYEAHEITGKPVALLIPAEFRDAEERGFLRYVQSLHADVVGHAVEMRALRKDGKEFPVEIALSVVSAGENHNGADQYLAACRDVTERNRIRSALLQSEKLASIGLLSAGVAHEINNPLAFVGNNLVVLERDTKGLFGLLAAYESVKSTLAERTPDTAAQIQKIEDEIDLEYLRENLGRLLARTRDGVDRVTRIVHSLRGLARTDAPRHQLTSIPDLVENSLEILRGRFKRSGILVEQEHDANPRLPCVQTQISQVLLNLLVNAFQAVETYRKEGGRITIRTRRLAEDMLIEISDNGPGIPPDVQAKVFDPFFTTKDVGEGTGLGLSITHNIIINHGGRIEVDSQAGQGARFRIYLPLTPSKDKS